MGGSVSFPYVNRSSQGIVRANAPYVERRRATARAWFNRRPQVLSASIWRIGMCKTAQ